MERSAKFECKRWDSVLATTLIIVYSYWRAIPNLVAQQTTREERRLWCTKIFSMQRLPVTIFKASTSWDDIWLFCTISLTKSRRKLTCKRKRQNCRNSKGWWLRGDCDAKHALSTNSRYYLANTACQTTTKDLTICQLLNLSIFVLNVASRSNVQLVS